MKLDVIKLAKEAGYGEAMVDLHGPALERFAALVIEECALEADRQSEDEPYGHAKFRCANIALEIRAMKEPE